MEQKDILDLMASDNPDMLLIASVAAMIKALRLSAREHLNLSKAAKSRANTAQMNGDIEAFHFWLRESLEEDSRYRNIAQMLQQFDIVDKEQKEVQKPQSIEK